MVKKSGVKDSRDCFLPPSLQPSTAGAGALQLYSTSIRDQHDIGGSPGWHECKKL